MTQVCPVNIRTINERVARFIALFTLSGVAIILFFGIKWLLFFLIADFFLRGFYAGRYSPVKAVSKYLAGIFKVGYKPINTAPKEFAARVGFLMLVLITIFWYVGLSFLAYIFGGMLLIFSFLEAAFGFCVACKIYPFFYKK